jgi:nucleotide-binding universal stress UspA family protein
MTWRLILVPHDFSKSANHAAALARDEAKLRGAEILLVHVVDLPEHTFPDAVITPDDTKVPTTVRDYALRTAQTRLEDLAARLTKDGVTVTTRVRTGQAADEILAVADVERVDAIVMGTHGHTGVRKWIAGSVAERVIRAANVPVMVVRHPD